MTGDMITGERLTAQHAIQQVLLFDQQEHPAWMLTNRAREDLGRMLRTINAEAVRELGS